MRRARTADRLSFALCCAFVLLGAASAGRAEGVLARVEPEFREILRPSLDRLFRGAEGEELDRAVAAARGLLEQAARDEPDTRLEARLVFARPFDRDAVLGLRSALTAELLSLIAAGKVGQSFYSSDYDLAVLPGDLAAKLAAIEERHRAGLVPTPRRLRGARVVSESGASSLPLPDDGSPVREQVHESQQAIATTPLQFVEARLVSTPRQLLRELERDPRILAIKLRP